MTDEIRDIGVHAVRRAGECISNSRSFLFAVDEKEEGSDDIVTSVDREAERIVVQTILESRPDDGIMAEEGTRIASRSGLTWIIDPLDGTNNFATDLYPFVSSVAVVNSPEIDNLSIQDVVFAAVYDPRVDELFEASSSASAHLNGREINARWPHGWSSAKVSTAWSKKKHERPEQLQRAARLSTRVGGLNRSGAAVWDICQVAAGRLQAYFYDELKPWDFCAATSIAHAAGCVVRSLDGTAPRPNHPILISAPEIADEFTQVLREVS